MEPKSPMLPSKTRDQIASASSGNLLLVYEAIFNSVKEISSHLRNHQPHQLDTVNDFGEVRLDMDVQTDSLIYDNLKKCKQVTMAMSEERPYPTAMSKQGSYIVTFDPIDGSNIIESNYTVGSIFGIWPNGDINGMSGRDMVGAALAVYGSRTTMIIYNSNNN